jgi:sortase A
MLGWGVLIVAEGAVAQWTARRSLEIATGVDAPATSRGAAPASGVAPRGVPIRGAAIAALSIPRIHLSAVVLHGSDTQTLRRGPGHLENTALPGEPGNVVIAGHRDSFFRPLRTITAGDDIFLDTSHGRFHYRVSSLRVVSAQDLSVVKSTHASVLTLITCYPFSLIGHAPDRFIVRADRVDEPLAAPTALTSELMAAPVIHPPAARSADLASRAAPDDEGRVREVTERFRLVYNARLFGRGETTARQAVTFQRCDVVTDADRATAICAASSRMPDEHDLTRWTFTLDRDGSGWAIRAVRIE